MQTDTGALENDYVLKEYLLLVDQAVRALPAQQQKIYLLSREEHKTYEEIAAELQISAHTVRNHMAVAKASIRKYLLRHTLDGVPIAVMIIWLGNQK